MSIPVNPTAMPSLSFDIKGGESSKKMHVSSNKIGWLHGVFPSADSSFNLIIKDGLGREKFRRTFKGERPGEYINVPTQLGEEIEVVLENVQNAEKGDIFLN